MAQPKLPSSSTAGFFQEPPVLPNQFEDDAALRSAFNLFLHPSVKREASADLTRLGARVLSTEIQGHLCSAEHTPPTLQTWDSFGRRADRLVTSEGWRRLQSIGQTEGIVGTGYEARHGPSRRVYQHLKLHVWAPSSAITTCPAAMTDGAAALLKRHLTLTNVGESPSPAKPILESAYQRLVSRDPAFAWTSGQWMTERAGGSDVRRTETRAELTPDVLPEGLPSACASDGHPLGPWRIDGFKWFSSATDADMAVLLAKTGQSDDISAFFAPTRVCLPDKDAHPGPDIAATAFNGVFPQRLKSKLGTRALPTAELVLSGMRAHMLGRPGHGTREISTVLNITRIHNAVAAVSSWGRGLSISRAYSRARTVSSGHFLHQLPAHVKGLAAQHVAYRANTLFTFFTVKLLGTVEDVALHGNAEQPRALSALDPPLAVAEPLLRLLTPVLKATTALASIAGLRFCVESLGGLGYLEDPADPLLNVARLFRDANVLAIWEGTTDVMGADTVRAVLASRGRLLAVLAAWVDDACRGWPNGGSFSSSSDVVAKTLREQAKQLQERVARADGAGELLYDARDIMAAIAWLVAAVLLMEDAVTTGDAISNEMAMRWLETRPEAITTPRRRGTWKEQADCDHKIVFGPDVLTTSKL